MLTAQLNCKFRNIYINGSNFEKAFQKVPRLLIVTFFAHQNLHPCDSADNHLFIQVVLSIRFGQAVQSINDYVCIKNGDHR